MFSSKIKLGLGLIGIGREWGYVQSTIPNESDALNFLNDAYKLNIDFFDTAPAYGLSENRFGEFLNSLSEVQKRRIKIASKFGEHWDIKTNDTHVDHSYNALCKSIDQSLYRLGRVDILQLHKSTLQVLMSEDLKRAIDYAKKKGIKVFGASVSDIQSGYFVCESDIFSIIQLPYNITNTTFEEVIDLAIQKNKYVLINRPFGMGKILYKNTIENSDKILCQIEAYKFILQKKFSGVILSGTKSIQHLQENIESFNIALKQITDESVSII